MDAKLPKGWSDRGGRLRSGYRFKDFVRGMTFLQEVAFVAESLEHHPDFAVHWNEVRFEVWSHDAGKVTDRDHRLAAKIAKVAARHGAEILSPARKKK